MRDPLEWEKEMRKVYRHERLRKGHGSWHVRISKEIAMEIQDARVCPVNIDITTTNLTWQGLPMRIDWTLNPGCFVFDEGEIV